LGTTEYYGTSTKYSNVHTTTTTRFTSPGFFYWFRPDVARQVLRTVVPYGHSDRMYCYVLPVCARVYVRRHKCARVYVLLRRHKCARVYVRHHKCDLCDRADLGLRVSSIGFVLTCGAASTTYGSSTVWRFRPYVLLESTYDTTSVICVTVLRYHYGTTPTPHTTPMTPTVPTVRQSPYPIRTTVYSTTTGPPVLTVLRYCYQYVALLHI